RVSLRPVYCLGACACSPAAEVDGKVHARLTPERLHALNQRQVKRLIRHTAFLGSTGRALGAWAWRFRLRQR
ncbi:NAD(P)H-dependent oxidoreductase subunit E, partial [Pseudomonas otitidis]